MVPGVCALVENWLREVVLSNFRECKTQAFTLNAWFDHPGVPWQLQVKLTHHSITTASPAPWEVTSDCIMPCLASS
jgi:hypothetical protein